MAAKENQGLQAVVIVLTIFLLLFVVGLVVVNNWRKTAIAERDASRTELNEANSKVAKAEAEAGNYKNWIGFKEDALFESLQPQFDEDMKRFGIGDDEASKHYKTMLENVFEEKEKLVKNEVNTKAEVKSLKEKLVALEAEKDARVKEHLAALEKAKQDLADVQAKSKQQYDEISAKNNAIAASMEKDRATHAEAMSKLEAEKSAAKNASDKQERMISKLQEGLPKVDAFAQPADGRITWVNQRHGKVWIDLGSDDGLRPQVTFSVAGEGNADAEAAAKKGSIEITRIIDGHMAEAQITSDDPKNPILTGDRVFSQVWDRGRTVGFAIAGEIDLDKDGKDDLQKLKNIIAASNGRVDAAIDDAGKLEGDLKLETRYLVLGEYPDGTQARDQAIRDTWNTLSEDAGRLGIETIPLDEFIKLMGWRVDNRSVVMGYGSRAEDFPPEKLGEQLPRKTVQPAGVFKKRTPTLTY
ncbi:hypothetical protein [Lacipirellula parvula]|uniref:Uncharacterized protein n=1 Tax=Lacipirellula parvula TaxID=2650471 RepID=A0A5K7XC27_9BACT|nr:hypothetical protein [Lacipirellula parvula]BBO33577.1 hypothetical protein PLANPX_3189 [Lacipirellula parvula]